MKGVARHPVIAFTVLTYLLSWWPLLVDSDISGGIFPFGPTLAAIIVTALLLGRPGLRELWDRQIRRPPRRRWYAIVLAVPIAYSLLAVAITLALGATAETDELNKLAIFPALLIIRIVLAGPLGEELGWRGFALPRLQIRLSALEASLVVGVIWATWHLPFLISGDSSGGQFAALWVSTLSASVILTWVFNSTNGSVLMTTLLHGTQSAMAGGSFSAAFDHGADLTTWSWALAGTTVLTAIIVIVKAGPQQLSNRPRQQLEYPKEHGGPEALGEARA
jgi:membrane protease YdiL (CAAX protease family)